MKIAIIGYSGAGKSTLAQKLGQLYQIPVLHMDTLQFGPHWQARAQEAVRADLKAFMQQENWVIDGNYSFAYYEERMEQADQIIFLNFPRWSSLYRAIKRYIRYHGKTRDSMAANCPEKLDWEFIRWILWDGRRATAKQRYQSVCQTYEGKVTILSSQKQIASFLNQSKSL